MKLYVEKTENKIQILEINFKQSGQRFTKCTLRSSKSNVLKLKCSDFENGKNWGVSWLYSIK